MLHKIDAIREKEVTMNWIVNVAYKLPQRPLFDLFQNVNIAISQTAYAWVYVGHPALNNTYKNSLEWQHNIFTVI